MKKTIILSFALIALAFGACNSSTTNTEQAASKDTTSSFQKTDTTQLAAGTTYYQCPMHLEEVSAQPGACPQCGMDLEKVVKQ